MKDYYWTKEYYWAKEDNTSKTDLKFKADQNTPKAFDLIRADFQIKSGTTSSSVASAKDCFPTVTTTTAASASASAAEGSSGGPFKVVSIHASNAYGLMTDQNQVLNT